MNKKNVFFIMLVLVRRSVLADHFGMVQVLKTFVAQRHLQTVTVDTCWPFDDNAQLLKNLSSTGVSVSFCSHARQSETWYRSAFVVDLSCKNYTNTFQQISNDRLFNTQNDWILFDRSPITNKTNLSIMALKIFDFFLGKAYVLPDSRVFLFQETNTNVWEIWSGFRASKSDRMRVFKVGKASTTYLNIEDINHERRNFRGITLKSTSVIIDQEHFFGFNKKNSSEIDVFAHMHYEMVNTLSQQLNFKIDLSFVNDYGWSLGNGSFSGLTGLLQKETTDFSATGVILRADRMNVIDYTVGIVELRTSAMFRQPSLSSVHNILTLPFTLKVWIVLLVIFFIFVLILMFLTYIGDHFRENEKSSLNVPEIIILVHGAICQQGLSFTSNLKSIRVLVFILFLTSLFLFTSYSASIAALIQSNSNSIKSIRDLVELPMTFSAQTTPYGKHYLEESDDLQLQKLYMTKIIPSGSNAFVRASVGIEKMRREFHGFLVEVISAYKIIGEEWHEEEKCGLGEIKIIEIPLLSIALVKKSGHKDIFKQKLIQQMEVGLSKRTTYQWIAPKPSCGSSGRAKQYVSVSVKEIYLTLNVFGVGVCISLAVFALEMLHHARMVRQGRNNSRGQRQLAPNILVQNHL